MNQGINKHGIEQILPEYCVFATRNVNEIVNNKTKNIVICTTQSHWQNQCFFIFLKIFR